MDELDTSDDAQAVRLEILRGMGPERRLQVACELTRTARRLSEQGVIARHPEYDSQQVRWALHRLWLGDDLFAAAYPSAQLLDP